MFAAYPSEPMQRLVNEFTEITSFSTILGGSLRRYRPCRLSNELTAIRLKTSTLPMKTLRSIRQCSVGTFLAWACLAAFQPLGAGEEPQVLCSPDRTHTAVVEKVRILYCDASDSTIKYIARQELLLDSATGRISAPRVASTK